MFVCYQGSILWFLFRSFLRFKFWKNKYFLEKYMHLMSKYTNGCFSVVATLNKINMNWNFKTSNPQSQLTFTFTGLRNYTCLLI